MIVVDAAALVDALTVVEGSTDLRDHLASEELHVPALVDFEFVSALCGLTRGGRLSVTRAEDALTDFEDLALRRWPNGDALRRRAYSLRNNVSAYDASYVALAEALECPLLTRDARLARSGGHSVQIVVR